VIYSITEAEAKSFRQILKTEGRRREREREKEIKKSDEH